MAVFTVSRQFGSGGLAIATRVAESLGYRLYDRQLLLDVAEYSGVRVEALERVDEQHHGVFYSTLSTMSKLLDGPSMTEECFQIVVSDHIREVARQGNAVIVGRASQCLLRGYSPTFHVFVVAPFISRVERIAERLGISLQKASEVVQECDDDRRAYTLSVAHCDGSDPLLYDLVINTDQLSVDAAADLILTAGRRSGILGATPTHRPHQEHAYAGSRR
jgi:CMP/dCMP kinase